MLVSPPHLLTYDLSYLLIATVSLLVWLRDDPKLLYPILFVYGSATLAPLYVATQFSLVPLVLLGTLGYLAWQAQQESSGVRAVSNS